MGRTKSGAALALGLTLSLSCVGFVPGIQVSMHLVAPRPVQSDGLEAASILVDSVELSPCDVSRNEWSWLTSTALAHGSEMRTQMIDLRDTPRTEVDVLTPQPGDYCGVVLHLGTSTDEAAWVSGELERHAPQQDIYLAFETPRSYDSALEDQVTIDYDPQAWMRSGAFAEAFEIRD